MGLFSSKEWHEAATEEEMRKEDRKFVDLGGTKQVGLFRVDDAYYAVGAYCSHERMSLMHGELDGYEIVCPIHGARFDIRNGQNLSLPAVRPIATYPVKIENGNILVKA